MRRMRCAATIAVLLISTATSAHERCRCHEDGGEVLNGRLNTGDFDGGVGDRFGGSGAYGYGGVYVATAGGAGAFGSAGGSSGASASASASASAAASAHVSISTTIFNSTHVGGGMHGGGMHAGGYGGGHH